MKTNIFLVHTEYHLMLSINLIVSKFMDMVNHIYITEGKRVRKDLFVTEKNIQIHRIEAKNYGTSEFLHQLLDKEPANFFFFQEVSSDNMYLSYWLHHKGVNVALLQDGLKPYVDWKRKNLAAHILLDTIMFHKEILKRKTYMPYFKLNNLYHYGGWDFIDEVWLSFPDKFKNKANKKLRQLPDFTYRSIDILNKMFGLQQYAINPNDLLIVGQPRSKEYWDKEIEILNGIISKFPNKQVLYKSHPNTQQEFLEQISQIKGLNIVNYPIPVELLIMQMKDTCIISGYSTALLINNPTCRLYWTYKLLGGGGRLFTQVQIVNPTEHIKEVSTIDEIV